MQTTLYEMIATVYDLNIAAQRTNAVLGRMLEYPGIGNNPIANRLYTLLLEFHRVSGFILDNIRPESLDLKNNLEIIYRCQTMIEEHHTMLIRTLKNGSTNPLEYELNGEIKKLNKLLVKLVPFIVNLYGVRETLFILTPKYQNLAGLW